MRSPKSPFPEALPNAGSIALLEADSRINLKQAIDLGFERLFIFACLDDLSLVLFGNRRPSATRHARKSCWR